MMKKTLILFVIFLFLWQYTFAQCYPDRHSTNWFDGWISCETSPNPNSSYGNSHWIMYNFGYVYTLFDSKLWNANEPDHLNYGIMDYAVDYSLDGNSWTNIGVFSLNQASGSPVYEGETGPSFNGITAQYVLITPISNFGGDCYGIGELKFYLNESASVFDDETGLNIIAFPNPFSEYINLNIKTTNQGKPAVYTIYDLLGRQVYQKTIENSSNQNTTTISTKNWVAGLYFIKIQHDNKLATIKVIKE